MYPRERHACEQDWRRAQAHARQFGDPEMWPFLTATDFRRAGPSRLLWNRTPWNLPWVPLNAVNLTFCRENEVLVFKPKA